MIQRLTITAVAVLLLAGTAYTQETRRSSPALSDRNALEALIDDAITEAVGSDHIAGGTVAIVKDGKILLAKGYGYADREAKLPVDPSRTVFRVGSVAKPFVGTAVMQLVEQGKLDLDADVNRYLSTFQIPRTYAEPITLRHLLTHTAGFEERIIGNDRNRREDDIRPLAEALPDLMPARVRPPGKIASYSNWSVTLAGHIVELVSGLSFAEYVERHIFAPLGMTHSTFQEPLPPRLEKDLAVGYHYRDGAFVPQAFEFISDYGPAGALSSTASDMARFMIAHLQKGRSGKVRILSNAAAAEMHRRQFGSHPRLPGMAINFGVASLNGSPMLQHTGATFVFHANMALFPREGVGLFVAFNGPGSAGDKVLKAFLDRYYPEPTPSVPEPPTGFDAHIQKYTGTYRSNRLPFTGIQKAMHFHELTVHDTGRGTLFLGDLLSEADNPDHGLELVELEPDLFWNADKNLLVAFSEGESGEVENLFVGSSMPSFHRIAWYETVHVLGCAMALSFLVFVVGGARGVLVFIQRRRHPVDEPSWITTGRHILTGLCIVGAGFSAGFTTMILTSENPFQYPPGIEAMLFLPAAGAFLTATGAVFVTLAWFRRYGTSWARIGNTAIVLTSAMFLWFLDMWNILGWRL